MPSFINGRACVYSLNLIIGPQPNLLINTVTDPVRGYMALRRSPGYIIMTTRYSKQQVSKSRQSPCQIQSPESNEKPIRAMTIYFRIGLTKYRKENLMCCSFTKVIKQNDSNVSLAIWGLYEDKSCDASQGVTSTNAKVVHETSLLHIESNPNRLGALSLTHGQRSQQHSAQIMLQAVLINRLKFP